MGWPLRIPAVVGNALSNPHQTVFLGSRRTFFTQLSIFLCLALLSNAAPELDSLGQMDVQKTLKDGEPGGL
jgi:hypothetical protein